MEKNPQRLFKALASFRNALKSRARALKKDLAVVYYAFGHAQTGLPARLVMGLALAYALSPVDLIPDFIPVLGYLDDLIIVPALIALALKLIPEEVRAECATKAEANPPSLRKNWVTGVIFIAIWALVLFWIGSKLFALVSPRS